MAEPALQLRPGANVAEYTVSELSGAIKRSLEDEFGHVRLRGEISGYRGPHASGHCYFALKDDRAKIEAVIWRAVYGRLKFKPEEGMEVIASGRITSYPGSSKYQIVIEAMEPAGAGALMAMLEERKKKLAAEGLFDAARKRKLPFLPAVVGIVTSPTGAVIRDMLAGFTERFPTRVLVWPVRVQGETCAAEVAAAIRGFNAIEPGGRVPRPDVLIVARGGGSLEDLWGFNDEIVVRAAAESRIPLVSAVGHETDTTLIDHAADARAPTPTKAAEWVVPKYSELLERTGDMGLRLGVAQRRVLEGLRAHLKSAARGLPRPADLVALPRQRFDSAQMRLGRALLANTHAHASRHARLSVRLQPRLLEVSIARRRDRLAKVAQLGTEALLRSTGQRRMRLERMIGRLRPDTIGNRVMRCTERLETLRQRALRAFVNRVDGKRRQLDGCSKLLGSLSYQSVLRRGFALVRDADGNAVRQAGEIAARARLEIELADGRVLVESIEAGRPHEPAKSGSATDQGGQRPMRPRPVRSPGSSGQGSLF